MCNTEIKYEKDEINGVIKVVTPYNAEFVKRARNLRGTWKGCAWVFDDSIEEYVQQLMKDIFGTTGETPIDYCTLVVENYSNWERCAPVSLFGRTIARAYGRDSGAKLGDGIVWISGNYKSGGSMKNWNTEVRDANFEIQNFPVPQTETEDVKKAIEEGWCRIKPVKKKRTAEEIQADIEKYEAILQELKNELNNI